MSSRGSGVSTGAWDGSGLLVAPVPCRACCVAFGPCRCATQFCLDTSTIRFATYTVLQQQIPHKPPSHLLRKTVVPFGIESYHCWTIKTTSLPSLNNSLFHKPVTTTLADNERCNKCRLVVGSQPFCPNRHAANNIPRLGTTPDPVHIGGANTPTPSAYVE